MKTRFEIPTRDEVSPVNQSLYDNLKKILGFVPNLYASFAHSDTALSTFLSAQNAKSSLTTKEKEAISLVVSEANDCAYCLSSHSIFAKKNGFSEDEIMEIRSGAASFNPKLDALIKLAKSIADHKGNVDSIVIDNVIEAGYTKATVIDVIMLVGIRTITNYVYAVTQPKIDWPVAPVLQENKN